MWKHEQRYDSPAIVVYGYHRAGGTYGETWWEYDLGHRYPKGCWHSYVVLPVPADYVGIISEACWKEAIAYGMSDANN